jgi:hypothetical protein
LYGEIKVKVKDEFDAYVESNARSLHIPGPRRECLDDIFLGYAEKSGMRNGMLMELFMQDEGLFQNRRIVVLCDSSSQTVSK